MTDRLTLAKALEEGGITRGAAEHIATEIFDAIHDNVATKQDLDLIRADLRELDLRLQVRFEAMDRRIDRVVIRLGTLVLALSGLILAAIRYLPHAGS
jgi:hypothetical protein